MADSPVRTSRRRTRLARGPLTIGEPAPAVEARLADPDPYRPDTIADGGSAFGLTVRAASVRGLSKRYVGGPRQDDLCLRLHAASSTLVVAVADGVSGASRSDLGAALAVRHAVAAVVRQLDRSGPDELDWDEAFGHAAWALVEEHRRATGEPNAGVEDAARTLATTLLVAAVTAPGEVRVAATGDSPAYVLAGGRFERLVGPPVSGDELLASGVEALPRATAARERETTELTPGSVLLLCTDGVALPLADGAGEVGRVLARELARAPDIVDFARLLDFSRSTYDDDRTLVAAWRPRKS